MVMLNGGKKKKNSKQTNLLVKELIMESEIESAETK